MRRVASAVYGVSVLVIAAVLALVMGVFLVLPYALQARGDRERNTLPGAARWAGVVLDHLLRVTVHLRGDPVPAEPEGLMVLCNHRSWLDPIVLMRHLKSNGLSKAEVAWLPFIGIMGWLTGAVYFDRRDRHARQRAREEVMFLIEKGNRMQVFPEGTRTKEGRVGRRVDLTLAMDCHRRGIPVLCCAVWRTDHVLPPGFFGAWWGQDVDLWVGPVLNPADYPSPRAFAQACWERVTAQVDAMAEPPQSTESSPSRSASS